MHNKPHLGFCVRVHKRHNSLELYGNDVLNGDNTDYYSLFQRSIIPFLFENGKLQ